MANPRRLTLTIAAALAIAVLTVAVLQNTGQRFRDCATCPEMVVVPAGSFWMGSPQSEEGREDNEGPRRLVTIAAPFAVGAYEVTFEEWEACLRGGGCEGQSPDDEGWGRGRRPVNASWNEAMTYAMWLSTETGRAYRLLTEAEWEYAARAGTATVRYWGNDADRQCDFANGDDDHLSCSDGHEYTAPVGSYEPNGFGLYDMLGNVYEWTQDCQIEFDMNYSGAPVNGSAWQDSRCHWRVLRGGSWEDRPPALRSASRAALPVNFRYRSYGFRVARTID